MAIATLGPARTRAHAGSGVIVVEGTFDVAAASALQQLVRGEPAVIDFSRARDIHDVALAQLATGLAGAEVTLRGLPVHHERLLRYLGTAPGASHPGIPNGL
jgi:hypothetical protein